MDSKANPRLVTEAIVFDDARKVWYFKNNRFEIVSGKANWRTPEEICAAGAEIARAHYARWSDQPVVVQKVIDQVPFEFEIVVPTPRGKQPVYPRMLFLRREVLTSGQVPAPVPVPPSDPRPGANEELLELPTPWTLGSQPPPPK
ncbi:MAG: hypothetical protein NZ899_02690 [Thermoguttaceae bacterium]|nr:hypothetical protein [Thermoguttaceae bacterium]